MLHIRSTLILFYIIEWERENGSIADQTNGVSQ